MVRRMGEAVTSPAAAAAAPSDLRSARRFDLRGRFLDIDGHIIAASPVGWQILDGAGVIAVINAHAAESNCAKWH